MRKYQKECPKELADELEALTYELNMENGVIDRYLDRHLTDTSSLEAPTFVRYMGSVAKKTKRYERLKEKVSNEVLSELAGHEFNWNLNFLTGMVEVDVLCDCDLPFLD